MSQLTIESKIKLSNGVEIPLFGLGTYLSKDKEAYQSCIFALKHGYIHIDTAQVYGNEDQVGQAIKDSGIDRSKLFITTKIFLPNFPEEKAIPSLNESLEKLGLEYVDLVLLHAPGMPVKGIVDPNHPEIKKKEQDAEANKALRKSAWLALEKFYKDGKTRSIGVSNFWPAHIDQILEFGTVVPHVNQIEYNPWNQRKVQVDYCQSKGILVQGWAPLSKNQILEDATLKEIAKKHGKTVSQISIRWHLQKGIVCIPKSVREERVVENSKVYDFELSSEEMKTIDGLDKGYLSAPFWEHDDIL